VGGRRGGITGSTHGQNVTKGCDAVGGLHRKSGVPWPLPPCQVDVTTKLQLGGWIVLVATRLVVKRGGVC